MIACYYDSKPYIFTINFAVGIATKSVHPFIAIGCGSGIATYILSWFNISEKMEFSHAVLAALYTIEEVKKIDPYCGGKAKVAILPEKPFLPKVGEAKTVSEILKIMLRCEHEDYVDALAKIDQRAKSEWAARMNEVLAEGNRAMLERRNRQG